MTSETSELRTTEQRTNPPDRVQLSAVQVAASALASVSAAVVASLFGVAGTVIGAGVVAVISTTGSAIYSASMKRTSSQLRRAREQLITVRSTDGRAARQGASGSTAVLQQTRAGGRGRNRTIDLTDGADTRRQAQQATRGTDTRGTDTVGRDDTDAADGDQRKSWWRRGRLTIGSRRGLKWPALVGAAALVFVIAIGAITAFEAITKEPISSLTGHSSSATTTIGSLSGGSGKATPTPAPTESGSGSDAGTTTPSAVPSNSGSSQGQGNSTPAPSKATPKPSASAAPSSAAPQNDSGTSGDSGSGSGSGSGSTGGTGGIIQAP